MGSTRTYPGDEGDSSFVPWEKLEDATPGIDERYPEDVRESSERDRKVPGRKDLREVPREPLAQRLRESRKE